METFQKGTKIRKKGIKWVLQNEDYSICGLTALDQGGPGVREPTYTQVFFSEYTLQRYATRGR